MSMISKLDKLYAEAIPGEMRPLEKSGDGKRAFTGVDEDGWIDFRIEIDTDDCDRKKALASADFMRALWNAWPEIRKQLKSK